MTYSALITAARIGLPVIALALVASIFLIDRGDAVPGLVLTERQQAAVDRGLEITNPTFSGLTAAGDPFLLEADVALPDAAPPSRLDVAGLTGTIEAEGATVQFEAASAAVNLEGSRAESADPVRIATDDGYVIEAGAMRADLAAGTVTGLDGVVAEGPGARIVAERAIVSGREVTNPARVRFEGAVRVRYVPREGDRP